MILLNTESTEQFLSGGGEMGTLIRSMDWSKTALGPIENWPQSLRTSVSLCLSSTFPILIAWGPETIQIYNDSYRPICGAMHPQSMGMNFRTCWESALEVVGDKFTRGQHGEGTYIKDQQMFLQRYGYLEEAFMTFSFAPIRDESGGVGGIFHPITETTDKMLSARRTHILRDLAAAIGKAKRIEEIGLETESKYGDFLTDLPFVLLYKYDAISGHANLLSAAGVAGAPQLAVHTIHVMENEDAVWPFDELVNTKKAVVITNLAKRFGEFSCAPYPEQPHTAVLLPIYISGQEDPFCFLVAGVSSRRALDEDYLAFYDLLGNTYNTAASNVYTYEQEQKRAEALAAIDRSKTEFFSNVSHEFRTPLTLLLGPLEEILLRDTLSVEVKDSLDAAYRNALRLLKLVNNLLDYSRVEAGRVKAAYQQVNLAELTTDLASSFRSIIEKADMELLVVCDPISAPTFVDRQMWEKVVLNLLSNAFKYTLEGRIAISLRQEGSEAVLRVKDTGLGIPVVELPNMFKRFHRVQNSVGRTHEGTGIGLSLVHELVSMHGGQISVESVEGQGSTFTVRIPVGSAHLSQDLILKVTQLSDSSALKEAFIKEAFSLLDEEAKPRLNVNSVGDVAMGDDQSINKEAHILIVDDNYDMRAYLTRLLDPYFTIHTAKNGKDALERLRHLKPQLVLSDVMMPVMDGKAMLEEIRSEHSTLRLPVIFLSARAGEEARIDGLEAGADDYLVKPFSAAELLTKIRAQIKISAARGKAEEHLRNLFTEAPVAIAIYRGTNHYIELANERMLEYWGRSVKDTFNKPLFEAIPELEPQGFRKVMDQVYQTGERFVSGEAAVTFLRYGKEEMIYTNLTVEALRDDSGDINGIMVVAADVTEQVAARREAEKATDILRLAVDAAKLGIWRLNLVTQEISVSDTARNILGFELDEPLSYSAVAEVILPTHRAAMLQAFENAVRDKSSFNEDYQILPLGATKPKWLNTMGNVELNELGEISNVIGTILDITEKKEDELRKNDFIGMVSHELKTPLTSLGGYAQLMRMKAERTGDETHIAAVSKIINQVKKMNSLINGFLNVSQLESGKIHLNKTAFDLVELTQEIIEETALNASGHQFFFEGSNALMVFADRDKIGTVLSNLLSNAVKYSPRDTLVKITCLQQGEQILTSVEDAGMGVKTHELDSLFDRYFRVENKENRHISGFGIGLYLSAEIIKRHNGKIWAESELGKGSTFKVMLSAEHDKE
ncbi:MAG: ATP-binding protein [Sphingobacteriaceae bacterium]